MKILSIEQVDSFTDEKSYYRYEGYIIKTDDETIKLGISNQQSCCENYGYYMSEDNINDFVGAELINIELCDTALNVSKLEECYEGDNMFVNIITDKGSLQFVAYNQHNGYYGHEAVVISKKLNYSTFL